MVLRLLDSWSNRNLETLVFKENRRTRRKTSQSKGQNQQQTQPTCGVDTGIWHRDLNPGHIGGGQVLSPMPHPSALFRLPLLFVVFTLRMFYYFKSSIILQMFRGGAIKYVIFLSVLLGIVILTKVLQNVIEKANIKSKWWCIFYLVYFFWLLEDRVNE